MGPRGSDTWIRRRTGSVSQSTGVVTVAVASSEPLLYVGVDGGLKIQPDDPSDPDGRCFGGCCDGNLGTLGDIAAGDLGVSIRNYNDPNDPSGCYVKIRASCGTNTPNPGGQTNMGSRPLFDGEIIVAGRSDEITQCHESCPLDGRTFVIPNDLGAPTHTWTGCEYPIYNGSPANIGHGGTVTVAFGDCGGVGGLATSTTTWTPTPKTRRRCCRSKRRVDAYGKPLK